MPSSPPKGSAGASAAVSGAAGLLAPSLAVVLAVACGAGPRSAIPADLGIEHVILISLDTLRADHLGCYGHPFVQSPAIDRIAAEGVLFTRHQSAAPTTLASHTSLMSGTYPHRHGVPSNGYLVDDANLMLAEVLAAEGFRTAAFVGAAPLDPALNFDQGFGHYDAAYEARVWRAPGGVQRRAAAVTSSVVEWLDGVRKGRWRSDDGRLFLFVHYFDVHAPYAAPPPYRGMYREDEIELDVADMKSLGVARRAIGAGLLDPTDEERFLERVEERSPAGLAVARALDAEYCAEITYCDSHVGRLLRALKRKGILERALVVLTADHGETMFEHADLFSHGDSVYETEVHTPLILRLPHGRGGGVRSERLVSNVDVMPTVLECLGLAVPSVVEGESFARVLVGEDRPRGGPVFSEATKPALEPRFNGDALWRNHDKFQGVRTERYKYMSRLPDRQFRLYDLENDPLEQNDLLSDPEHDAALVEELRRGLEAWRARANPVGSRRTQAEGVLQALQALGYVDGDEER